MAENKKSPMKLGPAAALALAQGIKAGVQIFQGFQQRADAKGALKDAEILAENRMRSYENFDFRIQNPYEDLTASTEAQQLANQQQAQQQANTLARLQQGATGAGAASLATAIARQGAKQAQAAQALTARQEAANERLAAGAQLKIDAAVSAKEQRRQEVLTSLALQDQAVQQKLLNDANAAITGGVGNLVAAGIEYAGGVEPKDKDTTEKNTTEKNTTENTGGDVTKRFDAFGVPLNYEGFIDNPIVSRPNSLKNYNDTSSFRIDPIFGGKEEQIGVEGDIETIFNVD